jgi:CubicO group peptidase (beta-lactamase class C family)
MRCRPQRWFGENRLVRLVPLCLAAALIAAPAFASPPADLAAEAQRALRVNETPGLAIAIVENGRITFARGFGVRRLGEISPVDASTIFQIGSTSKAFTAAALAQLVDEGKLRWDDRVIDHLPDFRMYDPWVTREITVRDLLVHRSGLGLGQGDLLFVPATTLTRAETVRRLRYLKPATSFRSGFAYDNVLYIVAGQLVEAVSGMSWEDYVKQRIFAPAGMRETVPDDPDRYATVNRAYPHARLGAVRGQGPQRPLDERAVALGANAAPAGDIAASAEDMGRWLQVQLGKGASPTGRRLYSETQAREMWRPVTPMPISDPPPGLAAARPQYMAYALGWTVRDYRGRQIITHNGATQGFRAVVTLIPEKNVGFAILANSEDPGVTSALNYRLLDHYLGLPSTDWTATLKAVFDAQTAEAAKAVRATAAAAHASSIVAGGDLEGRYEDPWYGPMQVKAEGGRLTISLLNTPGMTALLEPLAYSTYVARWRDPAIEPAYVTFALDEHGKAARVTMKPVSPLADFSFDYQDLSFTPAS